MVGYGTLEERFIAIAEEYRNTRDRRCVGRCCHRTVALLLAVVFIALIALLIQHLLETQQLVQFLTAQLEDSASTLESIAELLDREL